MKKKRKTGEFILNNKIALIVYSRFNQIISILSADGARRMFLSLPTMLLVCTDDLYYKREADWVGHKFRLHPWRYQELLTPMGPEAYKAVYWGQDDESSVYPIRSKGKEHTALM